jgi:hypothetical protein
MSKYINRFRETAINRMTKKLEEEVSGCLQ